MIQGTQETSDLFFGEIQYNGQRSRTLQEFSQAIASSSETATHNVSHPTEADGPSTLQVSSSSTPQIATVRNTESPAQRRPQIATVPNTQPPAQQTPQNVTETAPEPARNAPQIATVSNTGSAAQPAPQNVTETAPQPAIRCRVEYIQPATPKFFPIAKQTRKRPSDSPPPAEPSSRGHVSMRLMTTPLLLQLFLLFLLLLPQFLLLLLLLPLFLLLLLLLQRLSLP